MTAPNLHPRAHARVPVPVPVRGGRRPARRLVGLLASMAAAASLWLVGPTALPVSAGPSSPAAAPEAPTTASSREHAVAQRINEERIRAGLPQLWTEGVLIDQGRAWSSHMARTGLAHHPDLAAEATHAYAHWTNYGENVGAGRDLAALHGRFMASPAHRANVLGDYRAMGVGTVVGPDGLVWVTVRFLK